MRVIAVDDEQSALRDVTNKLKEIVRITEVAAFSSPLAALNYIEENVVDIAMLDINMNNMDGLTLAKSIKELRPAVFIVFITKYGEYAVDAFKMHASGYLVKPPAIEDIEAELNYIEHPPLPFKSKKRIRVQTFGNFEAFINCKPLHFKYTKTKELLAYLIDRRGAQCSIGQLTCILWEERADTPSLHSQLRNLCADLSSTLKDVECEDILIKRRGTIAIVPEKIDCDYYDWLHGKITAINTYAGEYMTNYSWAEFTVAFLESKK